MKKVATLFSYLFHPVFTPLYGAILYFVLQDTSLEIRQIWLVLIQIIIITIFIPIAFYYLLKSMGKINSVMASQIDERKIPLVIQAILLFILAKDSIRVDVLEELHYFFVGGLISTIISFVLLFVKMKSSLHLVGISSLTAFVIGLSISNQSNYLILISIMILLNGIIATSRLEMKAHTLKEVIFGFCIGFFSQMVVWKFWL